MRENLWQQRERLAKVAAAARLHAEPWAVIRAALASPPAGHGRGDRIMEGEVIPLLIGDEIN